MGLLAKAEARDGLNAIFEGKPTLKHEVLEPLAAVIARYNLPKEHFDTLLYAREFDLEDKLPATMEGMKNYADFTSTPLVKLALLVEGKTLAEEDIKAAGTSYALAGLLRATVAHARQRRCYLPEDLLRKAGVDFYALYEGVDFDKLAPVVKAVVDAAKIPSKLPQGKMAQMYLRQIEKADYNLLSSTLATPPPFMALRLWAGSRLS